MMTRARCRLPRLLPVVPALALVALLPVACGAVAAPAWKAGYSERLGREVVELDEASLNRDYLDPASGALTRVAWARLRNGEMVLLGLPPYGLDADQVIERTVPLMPQEWQRACQEALGVEKIWAWQMNHAHAGNSIPIHINNDRENYCVFAFLPPGWELRTVRIHGILKPFHQP